MADGLAPHTSGFNEELKTLVLKRYTYETCKSGNWKSDTSWSRGKTGRSTN